MTIPSAPARAYPMPDGSLDCDVGVELDFDGQSQWDAVNLAGDTVEQVVTRGFRDWNLVRNEYGSVATPVGLGVIGSSLYRIRWDNLNDETVLARTLCNSYLIQFNTQRFEALLDNPTLLEATARHEMGHALSLDHTGDDDSIGDAVTPTMSGAVPATLNHANDDRAQVAAWHTPALNAYNANPGFENQLQDWYRSSASGAVLQSTTIAHTGYYGCRFKAESTSKVFRSYTSLADIAGPSQSDRVLDAAFRYRKTGANDTGNAYGFLYTREVDYENSDNGFVYPGRLDDYDMNLDSRSPTGWIHRGTFKDTAVSTNWESANLPNTTVPYQTSLVNYDVRLDITTTLQTPSGDDAYLYTDDARVRIT